jgi:hypothetical protein
MEGSFGFPIGGDPEDLMRGLREFAEKQAESVAEAQREQFATLTLSTAVELTAAALKQVQPTGGPDEQAAALRDAMRILFPEAVALVSAARQGFMREGEVGAGGAPSWRNRRRIARSPRPGRPCATVAIPMLLSDAGRRSAARDAQSSSSAGRACRFDAGPRRAIRPVLPDSLTAASSN